MQNWQEKTLMVCDRFIFQSYSVFGRPTLFAFPTTSIIQFFNPLKIVHWSVWKLPKNVFCFLFVGVSIYNKSYIPFLLKIKFWIWIIVLHS